jgi:hypothetical protein
MIRFLPLAALLALAVPASAQEVPFEPSLAVFADSAECEARLSELASRARGGGYEAVEGPYEVAAGDVRIHMVAVEGRGHRISEHRCSGAELAGRSWRHSMEEDAPEFTVESVVRSAIWLKKGGSKQ